MQVIESPLDIAQARGVEARKLYETALELIDEAKTFEAIDRFYRAHCFGYSAATNRLFFPKAANIDVLIDEDYFEQKSAAQLFLLGLRALSGILDFHSDQSAFSHFEHAAKLGFAPAQAHFGRMYEFGLGVKQDLTQAHFWYQQSSKQNCAEGHYYLALLYKNYPHFHKPDRVILDLYQRAASLGFAAAMSNIGWMYANGRGVVKNNATAFSWYECAAVQGYARAQANLAYYYEKGSRRIRKDLDWAIYWYKQAALTHDYVNAQFNLAWCYEHGIGVQVQPDEALRLYQRAAAEGAADALFRLGCCYEDGLMGVAFSRKKALQYFRQAADRQHDFAKQRIIALYSSDSMTSDVTASEVREDFEKRNLTAALSFLKRKQYLGFSEKYHYTMLCEWSVKIDFCNNNPVHFFQLLMVDKRIIHREKNRLVNFLFDHKLAHFQGQMKFDLAIAMYGSLSYPVSTVTIDSLIAIMTEDNRSADVQLYLAHLHFLKNDKHRMYYHLKKLIEADPQHDVIRGNDILLSECDAETLLSPQKLILWLEDRLRTVKMSKSDCCKLTAILAKLKYQQLTEDADQVALQEVCQILMNIPPECFLSALHNELSLDDLILLMQRLDDQYKTKIIKLIVFVVIKKSEKISLADVEVFYQGFRELRRQLSVFAMPALTTAVLQCLVDRIKDAQNLCPEIIWYAFKLSKVNQLSFEPAEMSEASILKHFEVKIATILAQNQPRNLPTTLRNIQTVSRLALMIDDLEAGITSLASQKQGPTQFARTQHQELLQQLQNVLSEIQWLKSSAFPVQGHNDCTIC